MPKKTTKKPTRPNLGSWVRQHLLLSALLALLLVLLTVTIVKYHQIHNYKAFNPSEVQH